MDIKKRFLPQTNISMKKNPAYPSETGKFTEVKGCRASCNKQPELGGESPPKHPLATAWCLSAPGHVSALC